MNKVILIGNLANDPEHTTTQSGISRCAFRLAVQRKYTNAVGTREADFLSIICWRGTADIVKRSLKKGNRVAIEGSIQNRSYDGQDRQRHYVTEIVAESVEFLTPKPTESRDLYSDGI